MKRLHLHVSVPDTEQAIPFYNTLFGAAPVKVKPGYAKWLIEDPALNFAISSGNGRAGVNHLGIHVDGEEELAEIRGRLNAARVSLHDEGETLCCYARSDKSWLEDPAGLPWEAYRTMEDVEIYRNTPVGGPRPAATADEAAPHCCG